MTALDPAQQRALAALVEIWGEAAVVLVGGAAVALRTGMPWRATLDLDLAVAVDLEEHERALAGLEGWARDPDTEHRWRFEKTTLVDILPAGPEAIRAGKVVWPHSGNVMSLVGFDLALERAEALDPGDGGRVRVPPVPVLTLLKMVAFLDRPLERRRDLPDIAWLLHAYVDDLDPRRFDPGLFDRGLQFDEVSPFLLGADLGVLANDVHRAAVERFCAVAARDRALEGLALGPRPWRMDADLPGRALEAFQRGMTQPG